MPIVPPTSNRRTSIPYYKMRADASQVFTGLAVKRVSGLTRYGVTISEPISIPKQSPEIIVDWFPNPKQWFEAPQQAQISLQRLELTGGSRVRRAMPQLSDAQRLFICQATSFSDRTDWGRQEALADRWWNMRNSCNPQISDHLLGAVEAIVAPDLSVAQKLEIAIIHRAINPGISPKTIALHWAELGEAD